MCVFIEGLSQGSKQSNLKVRNQTARVEPLKTSSGRQSFHITLGTDSAAAHRLKHRDKGWLLYCYQYIPSGVTQRGYTWSAAQPAPKYRLQTWCARHGRLRARWMQAVACSLVDVCLLNGRSAYLEACKGRSWVADCQYCQLRLNLPKLSPNLSRPSRNVLTQRCILRKGASSAKVRSGPSRHLQRLGYSAKV